MVNYLLSKTLLLVKDIGSYAYLTFIIVFMCQILGFVQTTIIQKIDTYGDNIIKPICVYIILEISLCYLGYLTNKHIDIICKKVVSVFEKQAYKKHSKLSYKSKNKADNKFVETVKQAGWSIHMIIDWGFPTLIQMCGAIISCIYMFISSGLYITFIAMIILNTTTYLFLTKKQQKIYYDQQKKRKTKNERINSLLKLFYPLFVQGDKPAKELVSMLEKTHKADNKQSLMWYYITFITEFSNKLALIFIGYQSRNNPIMFVMMLNAYNKLSDNIQNLIRFMNHFSKINSDFETYTSYWTDLTFKKPVKQRLIPVSLTIDSVDIQHRDNKRQFHLQSIEPLNIIQGDKIIINGASGSGKTTFLKALLGHIKGIVLRNNINPEAYSSNTIIMYQSIREKMPFTNISIRNLFNDEPDNNLIKKCLKLCCLPFTEYDKTISDYYGEISGGEKTRLCLATRLHNLIKKDAKILVLDEPEQGLDSHIAEIVFKNVFKYFKTKTIIVVSHLCECRLNKLAKWNTRLIVENGIIKKF